MALFDKKRLETRLEAIELDLGALKDQFSRRPQPEVLWRLWRQEREENLVEREANRAWAQRVLGELTDILTALRGAPSPPPLIQDSFDSVIECPFCASHDCLEWRLTEGKRFLYCFRCAAEVP